jgi:hypothetical protein
MSGTLCGVLGAMEGEPRGEWYTSWLSLEGEKQLHERTQ